MRPEFELSDVPPVSPGLSPFHVRGRYYQRLLMRARKLPGGTEALLAEVRDSSVRRFLQQSFSWNGWYDALPTMPTYAAMARLAGRDFEPLVTEGARTAARELVPRFFRFVVQLASPETMAARAVAIIVHATDFVQVSFDRIGSGYATATGAGIPRYIAPNLSALVVGWFRGMLELNRMTDVQGRILSVFPAPPRNGFEIVTIRFEFVWQGAAS